MRPVCANHKTLRWILRPGAIAWVVGTAVAACSAAEPAQETADATPSFDARSQEDVSVDGRSAADDVVTADSSADTDAGANADVLSEPIDGADVTTVFADVANERDAMVEDVRCPCVPFDFDAGSLRLLTTSLECFGGWTRTYDEFLRDPCYGLGGPWGPMSYAGRLYRVTYAGQNLVGMVTSGSDGYAYEQVFDATTHERVGATRTTAWNGKDPIYCNQDPSRPGDYFGRDTTVRAGRFPNCEDANCLANSREQLCPPPEAGAPEGGSPDADDATAPPPDATDDDLADATDADRTDTAPPADASADASDHAEASQ